MNLGVSSASYYPLETELALEEIGKAGIRTTEIFFNAECELKPAFTDMLCDIRTHYGINVTAVHPTLSLAEPFTLFSNYDRRFNEWLEKYTRYSAVAAELGAKYIVMHGGKPNRNITDEEYCERYMRLKNATMKNGVTVLQENVVNYCSGDIEFLRSMTDILGSDAELCFDIKQAVRSGYLPLEMLNEFAPFIKHCHISDHSVASDCMLPGNGGFDFKGFFKALSDNRYNGACIIEVYRNAYSSYSEIAESYEKLTELI